MQPNSQKNQKSKGPEGFITKDFYAAVPFGKQLMVIYNGQQLEVCKTVAAAHKFINKHRANPQTGTVFLEP
jgi:hypothetical protein